jgi:hypothetical protein
LVALSGDAPDVSRTDADREPARFNPNIVCMAAMSLVVSLDK